MASVSPRAMASPRPDAPGAGVTESLERREHVLPGVRADAGTVVDDGERDHGRRAARHDTGHGDPSSVRAVAEGVVDEVDDDSFEQPRVCEHRAAGASGTSRSTPRAPSSSKAREATSSRSTAAVWTERAPAWMRLMARRLSTRAASRSAPSSMVARSSSCSPGPHATSACRSPDAAALMPESGVRRSWPTAVSSADRTRSVSASCSARAASSSQPVRLEGPTGGAGEGSQEDLVLGHRRSAVPEQAQAVRRGGGQHRCARAGGADRGHRAAVETHGEPASRCPSRRGHAPGRGPARR